MKERRDKGSCYHCDSKWNPRYKCPNLKLFMVEGIEELVEADAHVVGGEGKPIMEEEVDVENNEDNPNISLHAIKNFSYFKDYEDKGQIEQLGVGHTH